MRMASQRPTWYRPVSLISSLALVVALAACGSRPAESPVDSEEPEPTEAQSAAPTETTAATEDADSAAAQLEALYEGIFVPPPDTGPAAAEGMNVWYISCGESFAACSTGSREFQAAADELGWNVTLVDGQSNPVQVTTFIEQAITAGADGIAILAMDCAPISGALQQAQAADIPVVSAMGLDCDSEEGGEPLFSAPVNVAGTDAFCDFNRDWGKYKAVYIEATGAGEAILQIHETSQVLQECTHQGFMDQIAECETCEVAAEVPFAFATLNDLPQAVSSALLAHPDATAINVPADTLIPPFIAPAVQEQDLGDQVAIIGGEGYEPNFELIRQGQQAVSIAYSFGWISWGQADVLNRIFAEGPDAEQPNQGGGFQAIDAEHNLPPEGEPWNPPVDFREQYTELWAQ